MHIYSKLTGTALVLLALVFSALAQSPRAVDKSATPKPPPAPQSVKAKYEGGVFGYNKKQEGTLNFDDVNNRLVFRDKKGKDVLFIPYTAISQEFADSQANRPKTASILGSVPVPYGINPIGWIKTKNPYVTIQFFDQDSHIGGVTSFRVDSKEICASVVNTLAEKAGLVARGEIFTRMGGGDPYGRPRGMGSEMMVRVDMPDRPAVFVENEMLGSRVISLPRPVYPDEARQQKVAGIVRVLATVDENGNVVEAEAISGSPSLQDAAVNAAKQAKFEPLSRAGRATRMKTIISYNFEMF
jgi:TonB family protein